MYFLNQNIALEALPIAVSHGDIRIKDTQTHSNHFSFWANTRGRHRALLPQIIEKLKGLADEWKEISMLARTHGQPATPTNLGKEVRVWVDRLEGSIPPTASPCMLLLYGLACLYIMLLNVIWIFVVGVVQFVQEICFCFRFRLFHRYFKHLSFDHSHSLCDIYSTWMRYSRIHIYIYTHICLYIYMFVFVLCKLQVKSSCWKPCRSLPSLEERPGTSMPTM